MNHLAKKTEGFSGADLKAVVDSAIEAKLREAMKAGRTSPLNDQGSGYRRVEDQTVDEGMVRDGAELRAV
jgi:SpoVK/Ycf46/Vps4 family AAA+-type ATPase